MSRCHDTISSSNREQKKIKTAPLTGTIQNLGKKKKKKKKSAIRGIYTVATITKHDCCIDGTKRGIYSFFFVFQCFIVGADRNKDHLNVKDTHIYDMVSSVIVGYLTWSPKQYLAVKASQTRRPTLRAFKTNAPTVLNLRAHKSNIHRLQI